MHPLPCLNPHCSSHIWPYCTFSASPNSSTEHSAVQLINYTEQTNTFLVTTTILITFPFLQGHTCTTPVHRCYPHIKTYAYERKRPSNILTNPSNTVIPPFFKYSTGNPSTLESYPLSFHSLPHSPPPSNCSFIQFSQQWQPPIANNIYIYYIVINNNNNNDNNNNIPCRRAAGKQVVTREDLPVLWLETRPGEPPPRTGIPPALTTLVLQDFLDSPGGSLHPR